jgi:hypothetical protein
VESSKNCETNTAVEVEDVELVRKESGFSVYLAAKVEEIEAIIGTASSFTGVPRSEAKIEDAVVESESVDHVPEFGG